MGKKQDALEELFRRCRDRQRWDFDNELVQEVAQKHGFKNRFDLTKIDTSKNLPQLMQDEDYAIVHLGKGRHRFIRGIRRVYHHFEPIDDSKDFPYPPSLLNEADSSEANILSIAYNEGVLFDFLYKEHTPRIRPKMYISRRTQADLHYRIDNDEEIKTDQVQMEMDLVLEQDGKVDIFEAKKVDIFEAKKGAPKDFAIYQLYHPYLYYHKFLRGKGHEPKVRACYVLGEKRAAANRTRLRFYLYEFANPNDMTSIRLIRNREYILRKKGE